MPREAASGERSLPPGTLTALCSFRSSGDGLGTLQEPVYRGIVGIDIERYGRAEWTDPMRARLRERLYRLVDEALVRAGIDPALTRRSDRGDGLWLLVAADVSSARLLHPLVTSLVRRLRESNEKAPVAERMRLRVVVHAGDVLRDAHGETGASVIHAARLLDAQALRLVLSGSARAEAVLVVSDVVYEGVVRHGYEGIDPAGWQAIQVRVKETSTRAWVHQPGLATQPALPQGLASDAAEAGALLASLPTDALPAHAPLPAGSRVPLAPNPLFVGRGDELLQIAAALRGGDTVALGQVVASTGLGGLGKTQLAVELVHRYGRFFAGGVFWLSFASAQEIPLQVAACASSGAVGLEAGVGSLPLEERVKLVRAAWQSAVPRLLVFDNCEDEELLEQWRPTSGGCRVLVTSRRSHWSPTLGLTSVPLDILPRLDSVELLLRYRPDLAPDDPSLDAIADDLGDLPLALHLAGSYLRAYRGDVSLESYVAELRHPGHASLRGRGLEGSPSPTRHVQNLAQTFALSLARLDRNQEVDRAAIALLARLASMAPGEPVPRELLGKTFVEVDPLRRVDGLRRLGAVGLVEEGEGWLRLHRLLVHFVRQEALDPQAQTAVERAVIGCGQAAADRHLSGAALWAMIPHVVEVAKSASGRDVNRREERDAELCAAAGHVLQYAADLRGARPWFERALAIRERIQGPDHSNTAESLSMLAVLLRKLGALAAAQPLLERALAIRERALGPDHPATAQSLNDLATLFRDQSEPAAARPLLERALAIDEAACGPHHRATARDLGNLACVLRDQGELAAARPLFERCLVIREQLLGTEHPTVAQSLHDLASVLFAQGELTAARSLFERALAIRERALGAADPDTAQSLNNLAGLLRDQGELAAARPLYERALAIREQVLGSEHPTVAMSLNNLASLLWAQGDLAAASAHLEHALGIWNRTLGPDHLAGLLYDQGELAGVRPLLERGLVIWEQALSRDRFAAAEVADARRLHERVLAIIERVLGPDHPDTVALRRKLAEVAR